jgi:hypothetical protein
MGDNVVESPASLRKDCYASAKVPSRKNIAQIDHQGLATRSSSRRAGAVSTPITSMDG